MFYYNTIITLSQHTHNSAVPGVVPVVASLLLLTVSVVSSVVSYESESPSLSDMSSETEELTGIGNIVIVF